MRLQKMVLLVMLLFYFCSPPSFAILSKNLIPENTHENMGYNAISENNIIFGSGGPIVNQSKYTTTALRGGGGGGRSGGNGNSGNGNGGQSNSSPQGSGNGVTPVYAAGAASYRRNHKSGATTYSLGWKWWFVVLITTSAYRLLYISL